LLNSLKTTLTIRDIKHNIEEEERERLIIMPEKDSSYKIKINIIHPNTD